MTPPKTITEIQLEHGLCHCHEAYKSRDMDDPDCPMHSFAVEEAMEAWGEIKMVEFAQWLSRKESPYAVMNGDQEERFCDVSLEYTSEQLVEIFIKETSKP